MIRFGLRSSSISVCDLPNRLPTTAVTAPTTTAVTVPATIATTAPATVAALTPTTPDAMSAAAAPTASAVISAAAAALGKLRRYQYERRMSTIFYDHSFVCFGLWIVVPTFMERSCFDF